MKSVSLSSSMLHSISPPNKNPLQANPSLNRHSSLIRIPYSTNKLSKKPLKFSLTVPKTQKMQVKQDPKPIQDAYDYLILRDYGICREQALKFVSNKCHSARKLPSLTVRPKDKIENRIKEKYKIYEYENSGIDVDAINLALKNAIEKRMEKRRKDCVQYGFSGWKDENEKTCRKVRIIMKRNHKQGIV